MLLLKKYLILKITFTLFYRFHQGQTPLELIENKRFRFPFQQDIYMKTSLGFKVKWLSPTKAQNKSIFCQVERHLSIFITGICHGKEMCSNQCIRGTPSMQRKALRGKHVKKSTTEEVRKGKYEEGSMKYGEGPLGPKHRIYYKTIFCQPNLPSHTYHADLTIETTFYL